MAEDKKEADRFRAERKKEIRKKRILSLQITLDIANSYMKGVISNLEKAKDELERLKESENGETS